MDAPTLTPEQALAEIEGALAAGQRNRAIDLAVGAMGRGITPTRVLSLVAEGMEQDGLIPDSLALFNRAQFEAPEDIGAKLAFAAALSRHGADEEALAPLDFILARHPDHFDALMLRGKAATALRDLAGAQANYERAWAAKPDRGEALAELAALAARRGDMATARARGRHALALSPGASRAAVAVARADLAEGKAGDARMVLERAKAHPKLIDPADRADVLTYLGDALDVLDLPSEAFAAWREREAILRPSRAKALAQGAGEHHIMLARRLAAWFAQTPQDLWRAPPIPDDSGAPDADDVAGHVFVLGFPRSGTTLLEQVLAAHPGVTALDESEALAISADHLIRDDAGLTTLSHLTADQAQTFRDAYWSQVRRELGAPIAGKILVDKNPLNAMRLPIIAKLFPRAKIIFAIRDPRDVVLSGYRRLYYSQMLEFHTVDGAARFYDAFMSLNDVYRPRLPLDVLTVRHEDLVADFEDKAREVLAFLGLDWSASILDFADGPVISTTPSAAQIARGLNAESVGLWRRYAAALAPVLPILEPWAQRLGYEPGPAPPPAPAATFVSNAPERAAALASVMADLTAGRLPAAMAKAEDALARGLTDPLFHRLRGVRAQQEGRLDVAIADFEAALSQGGEDAQVLNALGLCLARAGRVREGLARLDRAIALNARRARFHFNRGWALEALGDLAASRGAYEAALALDPKHAQARANLAMLAARAGNWTDTKVLAERALALDPASPAAATALARAEAGLGDVHAAKSRLEALIAGRRADPHERAVAHAALGDVLDQIGDCVAAFQAYEQGAGLLRGLYAGRFARTESATALARRLRQSLPTAPGLWRRGPPTPNAEGPTAHVFLLGFPRSGTTMLGQALAGHPDVVTLDERSTLRDAAQTFLFQPGGLTRLAEASSEDLASGRAAYWRSVREGGAEPRGRVFVDKLPMNTLGLPLILKLFPDAKILFLRRDPRDVVLSCLRRQFAIDSTTIELLGLESAAGLYDQIMRLMETFRATLDIDLREQSFEDLVGAFETQMRDICGFLGLTYDPAMADFASRADRVATPSSVQLAQGLNAEGIGVWRRYRAPLAPIMSVLDPWVAHFGYDAD